MSESRFIADCLREFRAQFPAADGWHAFRTEPSSAHILTSILPAFLRSSKSARIIREDISTAASYYVSVDARRTSLTEAPFQRLGTGLDEDSWCGEIEFLWMDSQVHYHVLSIVMHHGETSTAMIAVKDRRVLESLYAALARFERRLRPHRRLIRVCDEPPIPRPKLTWDDVVLPPGMADDIRANVDSFFEAKARYKKLGIPYRRGLLFSGPPGNGKTQTIRVISSRVPATVFLLPLKASLEDSSLSRAFRRAADQAPSLLIIEDLDRLPQQEKVSMSYLLNLLDGFRSPRGVMVIATTNAPEKLDAALLNRPSRFDRVWHFGLPAQAERERLLRQAAKGFFSPACLADAAARSSGFTMAYVQEVVVSAMLKAATENHDPSDADLLAGVARLSGQLRANSKADGSLKPALSVGFASSGDNGSKSIPNGTPGA